MMADKLGETFRGYVTGVQAFGLFVELDEVYVQGLVHVSSMTDDYYQFSEKAHTIKGENTSNAYRLGDRVEVQVVKVDLEQRKIDFALVDVLERAAASGPARPRGRSAGPSGRASSSGRGASERPPARSAGRGKGGKAPAARRRAPRRKR